jgi:Tfp pilus assembly protein PilV
MNLKQNGISLIELLITVIVLSGSILALTRLQATTLSTSAYNKQRTEALAYAQQAVEAIRSKMERANCEFDPIQLKKLAFISTSSTCGDPVNLIDHTGSHNVMYRSCTITPLCKNNVGGSLSTYSATTGCNAGIATAKVEVQVRWDANPSINGVAATPPNDQHIKTYAVLTDFRDTKTFQNWSDKDWSRNEIIKQGSDFIRCTIAKGCLKKDGNNKPKATDTDPNLSAAQAANWEILSPPYCPMT